MINKDEYASKGGNTIDGEIFLPATNTKMTKEIFHSEIEFRKNFVKNMEKIHSPKIKHNV